MFGARPIYHHWFAWQVRELYISAKTALNNGNQNITLTFCNQEYSILKDDISRAVKCCHSALNIACAPPYQYGLRCKQILASMEGSSSCCLAPPLHDFMFKDSKIGFCTHQTKKPHTPGVAETCDVYAAAYDNDMYPSMPVIIGDVKKYGEHAAAVVQTAKYAHDVMNEQHDVNDTCPLLLGLPVCVDTWPLHVFVLEENELLGMEVIKSNCLDHALFATLYVATNYLMKNPIIEDKLLQAFKNGRCNPTARR